jgi:hypothetical protein
MRFESSDQARLDRWPGIFSGPEIAMQNCDEVCERDIVPGCWQDVLRETNHSPFAPMFILTSPQTDDRLGCEALNLGGIRRSDETVRSVFDDENAAHGVDTMGSPAGARAQSAGSRRRRDSSGSGHAAFMEFL